MRCNECKLSELDDKGERVCSLGIKPQKKVACDACVLKQKEEVCSKCGDGSTDWEKFGPRGEKKVVCRSCLCPDYEIGIQYRKTGDLGSMQNRNRRGFNVSEAKKKITAKQDEMGIPRIDFRTGGLIDVGRD